MLTKFKSKVNELTQEMEILIKVRITRLSFLLGKLICAYSSALLKHGEQQQVSRKTVLYSKCLLPGFQALRNTAKVLSKKMTKLATSNRN